MFRFNKIVSLIPLARASRMTCAPRMLKRTVWGGRDDRYSDFSSAMKFMERQMKQFDRDITQLFDHINKVSPLRASSWLSERQVLVQSSDEKNFRLELSFPNYKPEEIKVTLKDKILNVRAYKEETGDDDSKVVRELSHQYQIPDDVNLEGIRILLNPDGQLLIEAPLLQQVKAEPPKEIPITKEK